MEFIKPKRKVTKVFIHCSDSDIKSHDDISVIEEWHKTRGWTQVGYHYFITKTGLLQIGRSLEKIPSAQIGHNTNSISICVSGSKEFTEDSFVTLRKICNEINNNYDDISFHGHCEVSTKTCPVFDYKKVLNLDEKGFLIIENSTKLKKENLITDDSKMVFNNNLKCTMTNKLLQDNDGNTSSKRVAGFIILGIWSLLNIYIILSIKDISINKTMMINNMGFIMLGLLGAGVIEKFANKK